MVQILLVLEVLFTQDSEVEDLFCGASFGSEPSLFFSNYFFFLRLSNELNLETKLFDIQIIYQVKFELLYTIFGIFFLKLD